MTALLCPSRMGHDPIYWGDDEPQRKWTPADDKALADAIAETKRLTPEAK